MKLKEIYHLINEIQETCINTYDIFKKHIFSDIDYYSIECFVPQWIRDSGNSAESGLTKEIFERFVRENNNILTHKLLYYYDCDMLVASLQNRLSVINSLVENLYKKIPCKSEYKMDDFDSVIMSISPYDVDIFAYLNSIFIFLGSSFDIITKIAYELNKIDLIDYSTYPKFKSYNILFSDKNCIDERLKENTIFSHPTILRKIESIRNRIVHNGSFDFNQVIYTGYLNKQDYTESCILFPDFHEGNFVSFKNRNNFYSESNRINLILPEILKDVFQLILSTMQKINLIYAKEGYQNEKTIETYIKDIRKWSSSASKAFKTEIEK